LQFNQQFIPDELLSTTFCSALQDTQEALQDSTVERNALRRQLARMSKQKNASSLATTIEGDDGVQQEDMDAGDVEGDPADAEGTTLQMLEDAEVEVRLFSGCEMHLVV